MSRTRVAPKARQRTKTYWRAEEMPTREEYLKAVEDLVRLEAGNHPEKNPIRQRNLAVAAGNLLVKEIQIQQEVIRAFRAQVMLDAPNTGLGWTHEEDEILVKARADGEDIAKIAAQLGRTPAACATRLSLLVGIPKDDIVNAYIEGRLDGVPVEGEFRGRLRGGQA